MLNLNNLIQCSWIMRIYNLTARYSRCILIHNNIYWFDLNRNQTFRIIIRRKMFSIHIHNYIYMYIYDQLTYGILTYACELWHTEKDEQERIIIFLHQLWHKATLFVLPSKIQYQLVIFLLLLQLITKKVELLKITSYSNPLRILIGKVSSGRKFIKLLCEGMYFFR